MSCCVGLKYKLFWYAAAQVFPQAKSIYSSSRHVSNDQYPVEDSVDYLCQFVRYLRSLTEEHPLSSHSLATPAEVLHSTSGETLVTTAHVTAPAIAFACLPHPSQNHKI